MSATPPTEAELAEWEHDVAENNWWAPEGTWFNRCGRLIDAYRAALAENKPLSDALEQAAEKLVQFGRFRDALEGCVDVLKRIPSYTATLDRAEKALTPASQPESEQPAEGESAENYKPQEATP